MKKLSDIMRPGFLFALQGDATVAEAAHVMTANNVGIVAVLDGDRLIGVFSERDVVYRLSSDGAEILDWAVERIMTAPAITVEPATEILSALSLMTRRRIRHLPVVDAEALIGLVSIGDLVKHRMDKIEAEAAAMLTYIQQA